MIDDPRERIGRRGFLGATGAGALGLAGCIGGDKPEPVATAAVRLLLTLANAGTASRLPIPTRNQP